MMRKVTQETRLKMSLSHIGHKHTQETKDQISRKKLGVLKSNETKSNMSIAQRAVKKTPRYAWITPFGTYETTRLAHLMTGIRVGTISRRCKDDNNLLWSRIKIIK